MNELITQTRLGTYVAVNTKEPYYSDQGPLLKGESKEESEAILRSQLPNKVDKRNRIVRVNVESDGTYGVAHVSLKDSNFIQATDNNTTTLGIEKFEANHKLLSKERKNNPDFYQRRATDERSDLFKLIDKMNNKLFFLRKHHIQ